MGKGDLKQGKGWLALSVLSIIFVLLSSAAFAGWTGLIPPEVSPDWSLKKVSLTSLLEGWVVGKDVTSGTGVLIQYTGGSLKEVTPPAVSTSWGLTDIHLLSPHEGWAVGTDWDGGKGVLLRFLSLGWISVAPPAVSPVWALEAVHFPSSGRGWAVGSDANSHSGVLLGYEGGLWAAAIPPAVSTDWELFGVHFPVELEGWAIGKDWENGRGVLLHYVGGAWQIVTSPEVSFEWGLNAVQFISSDEGWAVGSDAANGRGVILHYVGGSWQSVIPPDVGAEWGLQGLHFTSGREGWAVGTDSFHGTGAILHYLDGIWTVVDPPLIGLDWGLDGVQFFSPYFGLAVGSNLSNGTGVILQYLFGAPEIEVVPNVVNFGNVLLESFSEQEVTVRNDGFSDLILFSITDEIESPFSRSGGDCESGMVLASGEECTMIFQFTPTSQGSFTTEITIFSNDPTEPEFIIPLKGGSGPDLFGQWKEFSQDCKTRRGEIRCEIKAVLEVRNIGNLQASSSVVKFYLSDDPGLNVEEDLLIGKTRIAKLKPAKNKDVKLKFKLEEGEAPTGKYLIAVVDADDDVAEANETNNVAVFGRIP